MKTNRKQKSKDELIKELKNNADFKRKMEFTRNKFYPALIAATRSVDDALQNLSIINTVIMEKFLGFMKEKTMKDINIFSNLSPEDEKYEQLSEMLHLFDDMSVFEAKEIMEGMRSEIQLFITEENKTRGLETLRTKWIDEL